MRPSERIFQELSEFKGELLEFKRQTITEIHEVKRDVKSLMSFKWKILGFAGAASFAATLIVEIIRH